MEFELPPSVHAHESIQTIIQECTRLTTLLNEVLSLQKEFRVGQLENLVLLFMHADKDLSLHGAVDTVLDLLRDHYRICMAAEERLPLKKEGEDGWEKWNADVREYVQGCKDLVVGTAYWSYNCERYFRKTQVNEQREVLLDLSFQEP